jgi:multidrug efflux pump
VLSLLLLIAGLVALFRLPLSDTRTSRRRPSSYAPLTRAPAKVIADTVSAPLEQEINGVEDLLYMNSLATSDGRLS